VCKNKDTESFRLKTYITLFLQASSLNVGREAGHPDVFRSFSQSLQTNYVLVLQLQPIHDSFHARHNSPFKNKSMIEKRNYIEENHTRWS
jgi:hypothetical protein